MADLGADSLRDWRLACPACRRDLAAGPEAGGLLCQGCGNGYRSIEGVWRLLAPGRLEFFRGFLRDYALVRRGEGRGSEDADHYRRLPEVSPEDPFAWQWRIRRRSLSVFQSRVLGKFDAPLRILDLGAGCGWLSHRLSSLGHKPLAMDLSVDGSDGLVAARHYQPRWLRAQAEFERIPLADAQADLAVFNASFHYALDGPPTLREALRTLRPGGRVVILDSPIYRDDEAGLAMVEERHADFQQRFGTRSDSLPSLGFLTWDRLRFWAADLGLQCKVIRPWYGWKWALSPWAARLRGRREPARFAVVTLGR